MVKQCWVKMNSKLKDGLKEKIPELLKAFVAKFKEDNSEEETFSRDRLKQLQDKYSIVDNQELVCEEKQLADEIEFNDQREDAVVRWCGNEDRFLDQEIRQHDQMKGVENAFEIDPLSNLPAE